jgi:hypothetical protein
MIVEDGTYTGVALSISEPITIEAAPGAHPLLAGVNSTTNVITSDGDDLTVVGLTITGGRSGVAENIASDGQPTMTVTNSNITGANNVGVEDPLGGGSVAVTGSNVSGNTYGVVADAEAVTVTDSTVAGNTRNGVRGEDVKVIAATVADNSVGLTATGSLKVGADIVTGDSVDCSGPYTLTDYGYNLVGDASCAVHGTGSMGSLGAALTGSLGVLGDNGGPTETMALSASSPAVGVVIGPLSDSTVICGTPDQRGYGRPAEICDAGAYETTPSNDPSCFAGTHTTGVTTTVTYCYVGGKQTFTVPVGATAIAADVKGAAGGPGFDGSGEFLSGSKGGEATASLSGVSGGDQLDVEVGGEGTGTCESHVGGFNGGADGTAVGCEIPDDADVGGGGGGASDLRLGGATLSDRILVAGGAGGSGFDTTGGTGGGPSGGNTGVGGGGPCAGAGGDQDGSSGSGAAGSGSAGMSDGQSNGGGGGGYFGGAGGGSVTAQGCGGGGGSGYFSPTATTGGMLTNGVRTGDGIVTISYTLPASTSSTVAAAPTATVFGQSVTFSDSISPTPDGGTVQWKVDGSAVGSALPLSGSTDLTLSTLSVGSHAVEADYSGDTDFTGSSGSLPSYIVAKAATTTSAAIAANEFAAQVSVTAPGAGTPTGTVTFALDGRTVGTAPVGANGAATLTHTTLGAHGLSATYSGDGSFSASSGSTASANPSITAHVRSAHAKSAAGWYRSPVTVSFTCTTAGSPLVLGCPAPVTISKNVKGQYLTKTIAAADGGVATVNVGPISLDRTKPALTITGVKAGAIYGAFPAPFATCSAHDALSGLAKACTVSSHRSGSHVTFTAIAKDKAGNVTTKKVKVSTVAYFIVGHRRMGGRFTVHVGKSYLVGAKVATSKAPVYEQAALQGSAPHPDQPVMTEVGSGKWETRIHITKRMSQHTDWVVGVKVGSTSHLIKLRVEP